ncbi:MAG: hypothetical protein Q9194_004638 [Teloschistes cf. exilis]
MSTVATKHLGLAANALHDAREDQGQRTTIDMYTRQPLLSKDVKMTWYIHRGEDMQRDQKIVFTYLPQPAAQLPCLDAHLHRRALRMLARHGAQVSAARTYNSELQGHGRSQGGKQASFREQGRGGRDDVCGCVVRLGGFDEDGYHEVLTRGGREGKGQCASEL